MSISLSSALFGLKETPSPLRPNNQDDANLTNGSAFLHRPANATRTLENYKALAAGASTEWPGGSTGGGDTGSTDPGADTGAGTDPGAGTDTGAGSDTNPGAGTDTGAETDPESGTPSTDEPDPSASGIIAGAGIVSAPSMLALAAAGAVALLF